MLSWDEPSAAHNTALDDDSESQAVELALLLDNLPCGYALCRVQRDASTGGPEVRIVRANTPLARLLGIAVGDLTANAGGGSEASRHLVPEWHECLSAFASLVQTPGRARPERQVLLAGRDLSLVAYRVGRAHFAVVVAEVARPAPMPGGSAAAGPAPDPLRRLFEVAPDATFVMTAVGEHGRILEANDAASRLTGYSREQLLSLDPDILVAPEFRPWVAGLSSELDAAGRATIETVFAGADGSRTAVEVLALRHIVGGQATLLAVVRDTTDLVRAQETIRQRERELEALVQSLDDLVFEVDSDLRFVGVWAATDETLFTPREQLLGRTVVEACGEELGALLATALRQCMESGTAVTIEYAAPWPGPPRWFSARISPVDASRLLEKRAVVTVREITTRRQAEEQLRSSEEKFRTLWERSPIALLLYDRDGTILNANQAARELFAPEVAVSESGFNFFEDPHTPEAAKAAAQRGEQTRYQGSYSFQTVRAHGLYPTRRADNIDIDVLITPLLDGQQQIGGYLVQIQDITERKAAERALQKSEERYRLLFTESMIGYSLHEVILDESGKPYDYLILEVNPVFEQITGLRRDDVVGRRVSDAMPETETSWIERMGRVAMTGQPDAFDSYHRETGRYFEVRAYSPQPRQFAVLSLDVTERRLAELALRESEERYRLLAENMQDTLFSYDLNGRLRYVNQAVETLTGYPAADYVSGRLLARDTVHPEDRSRALRHWSDAVDRASASTTEYRIITKGGELKWVSASFNPAFDEQHRQVGAQLLVSDVTERHRLQEQLLQAHKMESVGRLAGGVAHDFNNILTAISGYAEFVLEQLGEDSDIRSDVVEVIRNAERAANLTRQLLAFSRKQAMAMHPTDLNALVADMGRMLGRLIGEHIELVLQPGAELPMVQADAAQIEQVLANLAVNARDAMPNGGSLTIATRCVHRDAGSQPGASGLPVGDYVCIDVTDTGHGMSPEVLEHLFEPFFTTKEVGKGTGLGLATIYGIVNQHGGDIVVRSEVGRGSVFSVYLPAIVSEAATRQGEPLAAAARGSETVLLVEDEAAVRATVRRALERLGYRVIEASNGAEALEVLSQTGARPALVITDLVMPRMGGAELVRGLRATFPALRALFTSGYTEDTAALARAVDAGNHYLQKPFNVAELSLKVRQALSRE